MSELRRLGAVMVLLLTISDQQVSLSGTGPQPSARLINTAWQVTASWLLTGEDATFSSVVPRRYFNPRAGGWGALQLVARYSKLDIDPAAFQTFADLATSARSAQEWAVGLNWYLNRNLRVNLSFSHIEFVGGGGVTDAASGSAARKAENTLFTRVQMAF